MAQREAGLSGGLEPVSWDWRGSSFGMKRKNQSSGVKDSRQSDVDALLERWEEQKRAGKAPSAAELCADCPELAADVKRQIADLEKVGVLLEEEGVMDVDEAPLAETLPQKEAALTLRLSELLPIDFGGMGIVGRARDSKLRRDVAVKFMKPSKNSPLNQDRFLNEAKITGRLDHPGVLPVYGSGRTADNLPFYAMRYVTGPTFEEAIHKYHRERKTQTKREQMLALRKILTHFVSAAHTIAYAHERGVVHCDLKPQNILLGAFGETYVIDWGLAAVVSPGNFAGLAERRGLCGAGTQGYCHPEQLAGTSPPSRAWDVYSLGAVLYKLLANRVAGESQSPSPESRNFSSKTIQSPRAVDKTIPAALESICLRALGDDKDRVYERASEVADDVQRYLAGEPVSGHSETAAEKVLRWQRSHQGAAKMAGILLLALVSVLVISSVSLWRFAEATEGKTRESLETAVKFAAQTVALEMSNRWQALNLAARDSRLLAALESLDADNRAASANILQARLKHHRNSFDGLKSASWFLCNAQGRQVARSPLSLRSIGKNYAHRDYFHGNGRDFSPTEAGDLLPGDPPYIEGQHHSVVYQSTSDASLKVAYSVPVFISPGSDEERFVGVLGMSVQLGGFSILREDLLDNHHLILVDLREDWLSGQATKGLILHHPHLGTLGQNSGQSRERPRLAKSLVARLLTLRANDPSFYLENFVDPVSTSKRGSLAAFAKVVVRSKGELPRDLGWAVIVREKRSFGGLF